MKSPALSFLTFACFSLLPFSVSADDDEGLQWYRGNTHTHSLWSDGNDFPEMITGWYKENGYDFMQLSDHNILAVSEKWISLEMIAKRQRAVGRTAMQKYEAKYGKDNWIETREKDGKPEVRLKRIGEYRSLFEEPGKFLIVQGVEISNTAANGKPIHANAINLPGKNSILAVKKEDGLSPGETLRTTLERVAEKEKETGVPILTHLNHPNFQWAITAEELARVAELGYFEIYNGHPGINHLGDAERPGDEKIWDIANTIRLAELDKEPLLGVATDDSHTYHGGDVSPGRGWVMVRAKALEANALVAAMKAGDFYSSTGVTLDEISWDKETRTLSLEIHPEDGASYSTAFIGTRKKYDATKPEDANGIGEVFGEKEGNEVSFVIPKDALYLRATVTSSAKHPNPSFLEQKKQAWTQPVGWR